jgi:hypothetical protein
MGLAVKLTDVLVMAVLMVAAVLVVAVPCGMAYAASSDPYRSVLKMANWLVGAVPGPGSYNCVLKSSALLEGGQRPDSCVLRKSWVGSYAGGC